MARYCASCGAMMTEDQTTCPSCGKAAGAAGGGAPAGSGAAGTGGLADNVAGALAYVTIIPAILFLVMEPYNKNKFIRFHAFQCLFIAATWMVLTFIFIIPILGWIIYLVGAPTLFVCLIISLVKAYQGQKWKLPVIGDFAEKQADAI